MSGIYTVQFTKVSVTAAQDLFELNAHASKQCILLGFGFHQNSDFGDAQDEILLLNIKSGATVSGSGGTAPTPANNDPSGGASGFTAEANNTTKANTGTIVTHYPVAFNVRAGLDFPLPESMQVQFGAARRLTIELVDAPADALQMSGYAVVQEIG